jgi:putative transcriptional regulator
MRNYIAEMRRQRGISQWELAELMGVFPARISQWENGKTLPRIDSALKLAIILQCRVEDLFSL